MKAILKNYRQSPRKVRLIADLIRGKKVDAAKTELAFLIKRGALPFSKLLDSAVATARTNFNADTEALYVDTVTVDPGVTLKRRMPRARGSAFLIRKRTSHVVLTLSANPKKSNKEKAKLAKKALEAEVAAPEEAKPKKAKAAPKKKAKAEVK